MTGALAYDDSFEPPAPVVSVRIGRPGGDVAVLLPMLVDTGADCTLIPEALARALGLPRVDMIEIAGIGGERRRACVHAAFAELGVPKASPSGPRRRRILARVVAFDTEAILGRDVLSAVIATLDGPASTLRVRVPATARRP